MKILLDENLPNSLKRDFQEHEVFSVREQGWSGVTNGQLLQLMIENGFDVLLTFDTNLQYQQNFARYPVPVLLLSAKSNQYKDLTPLKQKVDTALLDLSPGVTEIE